MNALSSKTVLATRMAHPIENNHMIEYPRWSALGLAKFALAIIVQKTK